LKKVWIAVFCILIIVGAFRLESLHNGISDSVIRLHILADSNSKEAQAMKLKVRDFVIENYGSKLSGKTRDEALEKIYRNLPLMIKDIEKFSGEEVKISIKESDFPTKVYNGFTFPKGKYLALKIELGSGMGNNWWCVMYPPLCFQEVSVESDLNKLKKVLTKEEFLLVKEGKKLPKFKLLELWNGIKKKL